MRQHEEFNVLYAGLTGLPVEGVRCVSLSQYVSANTYCFLMST